MCKSERVKEERLFHSFYVFPRATTVYAVKDGDGYLLHLTFVPPPFDHYILSVFFFFADFMFILFIVNIFKLSCYKK